MLREIEDSIIQRLEDADLGVEVAAFPDSPDRYRLLHQRGAVLVAYRGLVAPEPSSLRTVTQPAVARWSVHVLARSLRGHAGVYELLEGVRGALLGWAPEGAGPIWWQAEDFRGHEDGTWHYEVTVACHTPLSSEQPDADLLLDQAVAGVQLSRAVTVADLDQY